MRPAPASGTRRGRLAKGEGPSGVCEPHPLCSHSLFEALFETLARPSESSQWDAQRDFRNAHWERCKFPLGKLTAPTGSQVVRLALHSAASGGVAARLDDGSRHRQEPNGAETFSPRALVDGELTLLPAAAVVRRQTSAAAVRHGVPVPARSPMMPRTQQATSQLLPTLKQLVQTMLSGPERRCACTGGALACP